MDRKNGVSVFEQVRWFCFGLLEGANNQIKKMNSSLKSELLDRTMSDEAKAELAEYLRNKKPFTFVDVNANDSEDSEEETPKLRCVVMSDTHCSHWDVPKEFVPQGNFKSIKKLERNSTNRSIVL